MSGNLVTDNSNFKVPKSVAISEETTIVGSGVKKGTISADKDDKTTATSHAVSSNSGKKQDS
jgi:hypothetical protein